ncbi:hypothetical protein Tco_1531416 [Tanacetum coccineum]
MQGRRLTFLHAFLVFFKTFLHGYIHGRKRRNCLHGLHIGGVWVTNPSLIKDEVFYFFSSKFAEDSFSRHALVSNFFKKLSDAQISSLESPFSLEEIKIAVWECGVASNVGSPGAWGKIVSIRNELEKIDISNMYRIFTKDEKQSQIGQNRARKRKELKKHPSDTKDHLKMEMEMEIPSSSNVKLITECSDTTYTCYEVMKDLIKVSKLPQTLISYSSSQVSNMSEDIWYAGSDTRPPMLDRTDFESWQQRIRLYCLGKDNGENIMKSITEGPFQMGMFIQTPAEDAEETEGALQLGPERARVFTDLSAEEKERYKADIRATNILNVNLDIVF